MLKDSVSKKKMKNYILSLVVFNVLCCASSALETTVYTTVPTIIPTTVEEFQEHHFEFLFPFKDDDVFEEQVLNEGFQKLLRDYPEDIKRILNDYLERHFSRPDANLCRADWFFQCIPETTFSPTTSNIEYLLRIFELRLIPADLGVAVDGTKIDISSIPRYAGFPYLWLIHQGLKYAKEEDDGGYWFRIVQKHFRSDTGLYFDYVTKLYYLLDILFPQS